MPNIIKSPSDKGEYRAIELDNGLKVMLVSDQSAYLSTAAIDIQAGSRNDPVDRQGLAHFLEHMLFLGTSTYQESGEYQRYIKHHGGSYNASTGLNFTQYFFTILPEFLEEALNRFAQFFISPLFDLASIERERDIVNSEFLARKNDEPSRLGAARSIILNPEHPIHKFAAGCTQTLADRPQQPIQAELMRFFKHYYHARRMALVITSSHSLDQLNTWAEAKFNPIASLGENYQPITMPLVLDYQTPYRLTLKPLNSIKRVCFSFPIDSIRSCFDTKPHEYLFMLLMHRRRGSLLDALKKRNWAISLKTELSYSDDVNALLDISILLSTAGLQHIDDIGELVFSYLDLIRTEGVTLDFFHELKQMAALNFKFPYKLSAVNFARDTAHALHFHKPTNVLSAPTLYGKYSPPDIQNILAKLNPDNVQLIINDPNLESTNLSNWFEVPFRAERIEDSTIKRWYHATANPSLTLPEPNPFIPKDISLISSDCMDAISAIPINLTDKPNLRIWHKTILHFNQPKSRLHIGLRSPATYRSPKGCILTTVFVELINQQLSLELHAAQLAGINTHISQHSQGLTIQVDGYSEQQPYVLTKIIESIQSLSIEETTFQFYIESVQQKLINAASDHSFRVALNNIRAILHTSEWPISDLQYSLNNITSIDLQTHVHELLSQAQIQILSIGNVSQSQSLQKGFIVSKLLEKNSTTRPWQQDNTRKLVSGQWLHITFASAHNDGAFVLMFQTPSKSLQAIAATKLIAELIHPAFFNVLRTQEKLGYIVSAFSLDFNDTNALGFAIQTNKHNTKHIEQLVKQFLEDFKNTLSTLSNSNFDAIKTALVDNLTRADESLEDYANRYWADIERDAPDFDTHQGLAHEVKRLTKSDVIAFYQHLVLEKGKAAALLVTVEKHQHLANLGLTVGSVRDDLQEVF